MSQPAANRRISRHGRLIIAGVLAASLGASGCGGGGSSTTTAATTSGAQSATSPATGAPLTPASLIAPAGTMRGFHASGAPQTATSAQRWAEISDEGDEVASEAARLVRAGFREGVGQHYKAPAGPAALSLALVFSSSEGAGKEVRHYLQVDPRFGLHVEAVKVAAIPGSVVVGERPAGNVLFATGRCFLLVGDELDPSATQAQVNALPIAAATVLYRQVKGLCAQPR